MLLILLQRARYLDIIFGTNLVYIGGLSQLKTYRVPALIALQLHLIGAVLYVFSLGTIKISLLLTYLRFFDARRFRIAVYTAIAANAGYVIAFVLAIPFLCFPVAHFW